MGLNQGFQVIFFDSDDFHFTLGVLGGVGSMGGIDHDGGAELAANGAGRGFGRVSGSKDFANFSDSVHSLINDCDALLGPRIVDVRGGAFAGFYAGHELDDGLPVFAPGQGA